MASDARSRPRPGRRAHRGSWPALRAQATGRAAEGASGGPAANRRRLKVRATVAGDGPALPLMRAYLRSHSMADWVHLAGRLDRDGVRSLLGTADIFVNPALLESFGIATLEARTAGVPIIARTNNGVSEFVHDAEEGLLCASTKQL